MELALANKGIKLKSQHESATNSPHFLGSLMKIDLDSISKRLCNAACAAFVIRWLFPASPAWLMGFAAVTAIAGLVFALAHEITARKQSERAAKPAFGTK